MVPITVSIPDHHADAIAAEVQRDGPGTDRVPVVRVWIGPALEVVISPAAADRLADALVDALAAEDDAVQLPPAAVVGW
jgi:Arc/MetJ-type ribon-helix-helix transcriptional regulator